MGWTLPYNRTLETVITEGLNISYVCLLV